MSEHLAYIRERIPTYHGYGEESARADSDKRVRAIVGEALSDAFVRFEGRLDAEACKAYDDVLLHCEFGDRHFFERLRHHRLTASDFDELLSADRTLVELEETVANASSPSEFTAALERLRDEFERRGDLVPAR